ncbi:unnamed protein product [Lampetra planeri]
MPAADAAGGGGEGVTGRSGEGGQCASGIVTSLNFIPQRELAFKMWNLKLPPGSCERGDAGVLGPPLSGCWGLARASPDENSRSVVQRKLLARDGREQAGGKSSQGSDDVNDANVVPRLEYNHRLSRVIIQG